MTSLLQPVVFIGGVAVNDNGGPEITSMWSYDKKTINVVYSVFLKRHPEKYSNGQVIMIAM